MARFTPRTTDVLDALAAELLQNYASGRVVVGVDGFSSAVTAPFADALAEALRRAAHVVFRGSMNSFLEPATLLYPAGSDPQPAGYDLETLHRVLLDPFRDVAAGSFVLAAYDPQRGTAVEPKWVTAKPDSILILDGTGLHSPELRGLWNFSLWLDSEDPTPAVGTAYLKKSRARTLASALVDAHDAEHPRRVFADSC